MEIKSWKVIQVRQNNWQRLSDLKKFPERASFDAVIGWLLDQMDTREMMK